MRLGEKYNMDKNIAKKYKQIKKLCYHSLYLFGWINMKKNTN